MPEKLTSMTPLHAQFDSLSKTPRIMHATRNEANGTETTVELERIDLYLGEASSITHMGATDPLIRVAKPMMKRPMMSCTAGKVSSKRASRGARWTSSTYDLMPKPAG